MPRPRSKVEILKELLRRLELKECSFSMDPKEDAAIKRKIEPFFRTWCRPSVEELLAREQKAVNNRRTREWVDRGRGGPNQGAIASGS